MDIKTLCVFISLRLFFIINKSHEFRQINNILYIIMSKLVEDENQINLLVKRNGEIIANYHITTLKLLKQNFKNICLSSEFFEYKSLDDFLNSIYFLEFLEYFLDHLHSKFPDVISYKKYKLNSDNIYKQPYFQNILEMCSNYVLNKIDIDQLRTKLNQIINLINKIEFGVFSYLKRILHLYYGLLYFTESVINNTTNDYTKLLLSIKKAVVYTSNGVSIQKSKVESCEHENILQYRKVLLSKFRLFQRKYLSAIAKLRRIGPPRASPEDSKKIKKELNKNNNVDYKAYEIFCKYVLDKEENAYIYDFLAGIHKSISEGVKHKNINNNTVANIKANTKIKHHKEYLERSEAILQMVEAKIEKYGDIIDKETKRKVEEIRKSFESPQIKFVSGNVPNNIIRQCKIIRAINKQIDKMIKDHIKKEQKRIKEEQERRKEEQKLRKEEQKLRKEEQEQEQKQKQRKEENNKNTTTSTFLSDLLEKHPDIKKEPTLKKQIHKLLLKYHPNKRQGLTNNQIKKTSEITNKLTQILTTL